MTENIFKKEKFREFDLFHFKRFFLAMDFLNHFRPAVSSEHLPCTLFNFDRLWRTTYSKLEGGGGDGPVLVTSSLLTMGKFKKIPRTDI